mmetsp:Transcript_2046/g.4518  ORF Transcript_2046/g.4518 Transcript_2046/m.4518 type:complete len:242 (-) Transcript_2046:1043-1768(-)
MRVRRHDNWRRVCRLVAGKPWRAVTPIKRPHQSTHNIVGNHKPANHARSKLRRLRSGRDCLQVCSKTSRANNININQDHRRLASTILHSDFNPRRCHASIVRVRELKPHAASTKRELISRSVTPINNSSIALRAAVINSKEAHRHVLSGYRFVRSIHSTQLDVRHNGSFLHHRQLIRAARKPINRLKRDLVRSWTERTVSVGVGADSVNRSAVSLRRDAWHAVCRTDLRGIRAEDLWWAIF